MPDYLIWLIACIGILGIEMLLSTFYLLAFSAGALFKGDLISWSRF